jgi:hypothetical protein
VGRKRGVQYRLGQFYRSDDRSGFTRRAERTRKEWTGLIVDENLWEARQPQDFVRGVPDDQTVPDARPISPAVFSGPIYTTLTAQANIGDLFVSLDSVFGMSIGDPFGVMLNTGAFYNTYITNVTASGVWLYAPMPNTAASGNDVVDYRNGGESVPIINVVIVSPNALTFGLPGDYVFTGGVTVNWTLPPIAANGGPYVVKNRGSAPLNLVVGALGDQLYSMFPSNGFQIPPGGSYRLLNDLTYWNIE